MKKLIGFLQKHKFWFLVLASLGILIDIFAINAVRDLVVFLLISFWILIIRLDKSKRKVIIWLALSLIVMANFLLIFKGVSQSQKAGIWAYLLLAIAILERIFEQIKEK